jgi:hypothetical protein
VILSFYLFSLLKFVIGMILFSSMFEKDFSDKRSSATPVDLRDYDGPV